MLSNTTKTAVSYVINGLMTKSNQELFKISGDPTKYSKFISTFETTIEAIEHDDLRKLLYLILYCYDKVKPLIVFYVLFKTSKAKKVLLKSFGRKNVIAIANVKQLIEDPSITHDNSKALISFSREIEECLVALTSLKNFSELNSFENNFKIDRPVCNCVGYVLPPK